MHGCRVLTISLPLVLAACGTASPPSSQRLIPHAVVTEDAGTILVVDVCLNYSPLGVDDYFVIKRSRDGAEALLIATEQYLGGSAVRVRSKIIPFVCGALHDPENNPKRVAERIDGEVITKSQPFWISNDIAQDAEYVAALQTLATYIFNNTLSAGQFVATAPAGSAMATTPDQARSAASVVSRRSERSSLLYIGLTGHSLSPGNAAAHTGARMAVGFALSVAIGPIAVGGSNYGVVIVPGGPVDKRQMVAGLMDLRQGALVRSSVVHAGGDPMKAEVLARPEAIQLLLRNIAFSNLNR